MARVYLGLGSNLGDREAHLRDAVRRLGRVVEILRISSVYRSEPVGYVEQPDFWNLVVEARTSLEPEALLRDVHRIEDELGRTRPFPNAPRVIDIDVLLYDDVVVETPELTIPHPRMLERAFVLRPLAELAPGLRDPRSGERIAERLGRGAGLERTERLFPGDRLLDGDAQANDTR